MTHDVHCTTLYVQMTHDGQCDILCPEVKMSTRGQSPSVDILTSGHIILDFRMTNCDTRL